jgi:hypothetical protein
MLTYMSIRDRVRAVLNTRLFCLPPGDGGEVVRPLFVSREVLDDVSGPFAENFDGYRLGKFRGTLDAFSRGNWVSIATDPFAKQPWAYFAPVAPIELGIWDIRSMAPLPQIRCFGGWAEKDTFVALTWRWRDDIHNFAEEAAECRREWDRLFPNNPPYRGATINDYIKQRYHVV